MHICRKAGFICTLLVVAMFILPIAYAKQDKSEGRIFKKVKKCAREYYLGKKVPLLGTVVGSVHLAHLAKCTEKLMKKYPNEYEVVSLRSFYFIKRKKYKNITAKFAQKGVDLAGDDNEKVSYILMLRSVALIYRKQEKVALRTIIQAKKLCKDCKHQARIKTYEIKMRAILSGKKVFANRGKVQKGGLEENVISLLGRPDKRNVNHKNGEKYSCLSWRVNPREYHAVYLKNNTVISSNSNCWTWYE